MNLAQKLTTNTLMVLPMIFVLAACSTVPQTDANNDGIRDTTERPRFFGRNAWDRKHADQAAPAQPVQPAPPAAQIAQAAPSPAQTQPAPAPAASAAPTAAKRAPLFSWPKIKPAPKTETVTRPSEATPVQIAAPPPPPTQAVPPPADQPKAKRAPLLSWTKVEKAPKTPQAGTSQAGTPQIVGGYGPATDKEAVAAAAAFALSEAPGYKFSAVYSAKVQIVAGTNYSLCLWVRRPAIEPNPFSRRMVAATVFKGLDQHYELVSWREVEHCRAGS